MQKYKQAAISIAFLTLIFTAGLYSGRPEQYGPAERPKSFDPQAIMETFENNDYTAWKGIVSQVSQIDELLTEEEFRLFVQTRQAARSGDYDMAIAIATELESGLKNKLFLA